MYDVIWHAQEHDRGYYNCTNMMNELFDFHTCYHFGFKDVGWDNVKGGAIVVVHGGRELGALDRLNRDIEHLSWVLLVFLGDEEGSFPIEMVVHPNKKVWIQEPRYPVRHDGADRYIIDGYPHQCARRTRPRTFNKDLDWVFAGQVTHWRRHACANALRSIDWGGVVVESKGYCQGVSVDEYYRLLERAHIVPCPSGPFSPDAARPWEALECGAIPILDELSPARDDPGFWKQVLGEHPLPTISDWAELPARIKELRANYDELWPVCAEWWKTYKRNFLTWLPTDIRELQGRV